MGHTTEKPRHEHDCDACHYLGGMYDDRPETDRWVDLYYCTRTAWSEPIFLIRHGEHGAYRTTPYNFPGALDRPGLTFFREARARAFKAGLVRPCEVEFGLDHDHDDARCADALRIMEGA